MQQYLNDFELSIKNGRDLKKIREDLKISQSKFSEITNINQSIISAYELEKIQINDIDINKINETINNYKNFDNIINRKKRCQKKTYDIIPSKERKNIYSISSGNNDYLKDLSNLKNNSIKNFKGVSLFSGIGGCSLGFQSAGFSIEGFVEVDDKLSSIYQKNFSKTPQIGKNILEISNDVLQSFKNDCGDIDCVLGGPPCQGFSLSGKRNLVDPRNYLFEEYLRIVSNLQPKVAILENVRLLTSMRSKNSNLIKNDIIKGFEKIGYNCKMFVTNCKYYGVPQHRERVIFIAIEKKYNIEPTFPKHLFSKETYRTFSDACSDLEFLESSEISKNDPFHRAVKHPDHVIKWLWDVKEGASAHDNQDKLLRPPSGYNTTYKRQVWNEPSSTVQTTFGMISGCRNVHPVATRSLTVREAARLQSFPDNFIFTGSLGTIRTGIGNAIPPLFAKILADHIVSEILNLIKVPSL